MNWTSALVRKSKPSKGAGSVHALNSQPPSWNCARSHVRLVIRDGRNYLVHDERNISVRADAAPQAESTMELFPEWITPLIELDLARRAERPVAGSLAGERVGPFRRPSTMYFSRPKIAASAFPRGGLVVLQLNSPGEAV